MGLLSQWTIVVFASPIFNSTCRPGVLDLVVFLFDTVRVVVVARNIVNNASGFGVAVPLVGDHAGNAIGRDAVEPRLFLGGDGDDCKLGIISNRMK
jgi:hypothetical protein